MKDAQSDLRTVEQTVLQQRSRIYRVAMLAAGILVHLFACSLVLSIGHMELAPVEFLGLASLSLAGFLAIALLITFEWNLTLEDPDMSLPQLLWAVSVVIVTSHFVADLKAVVVLLGLTMVVFGVSRLDRRERTAFIVYSVCLYGVSVALLSQSAHMAWMTEIVIMIAFAVVLVFGPLLHQFELSMLENVLVDKNRELTAALARISELAVKDELTGVYNRRHLMGFIAHQKALADRGGHQFTLCFVDLDFFKRVNDRFGHGTGDHVLKCFAEIAESVLREVDCIGRIGGEEFLLVLVGSSEQDALIAAERLAARLRDMVVSMNEPQYRITASMGITEYRPVELIEAAVERADKALYDAKRTGRNKLVVAELAEFQIRHG